MKCDKCFFCTHVGKGIYADYPVKFCKHFDIASILEVMKHD